MTLYAKPKLCACGCKRPRTTKLFHNRHECRHRYVMRKMSRGFIQHTRIETCSNCGKQFMFYNEKKRRTCSDECANIKTQGGRAGVIKQTTRDTMKSIGRIKDYSWADELRGNLFRVAKREGIKI